MQRSSAECGLMLGETWECNLRGQAGRAGFLQPWKSELRRDAVAVLCYIVGSYRRDEAGLCRDAWRKAVVVSDVGKSDEIVRG